MNIFKSLSIPKHLLAVLALLFAGGGSVQAASISYYLNLTNDATQLYVPDGTNYAQVTIDDEGAAGLINFTVTILDSTLTANAGSNFGLQSFGFNVLDPEETVGLVTTDIINLPTNWSADVDYTPPNSGGTGQSIFGKFDAVVRDGGSARVDPTLTFSIDNQFNGFDTISDYIDGSNSNSNSVLFVAHITGFNDLNTEDPVDGCVIDGEGNATAECNLLTSVWVGGSTVVPIPAAVWLFGSGLVGLIGFGRRKAKAAV